MPVSKKRKKKGKKVGNGENSRIDTSAYSDFSAGVTLQDLINVVAYQEYTQKDVDLTTQIAADATVHMEGPVPLVVGEGDDKREIGTASPIPGDPDHISIHITDPEVARTVHGPIGDYSIDKENEDGR